MKQFRVLVLVVAVVSFGAVPAFSWEHTEDWEVFGSFVYTFTEDDPNNDNRITFNKSWLISRTELDENTEAVVFLALQGQEMLVHDFRVERCLSWIGFDRVVIGRFIPPFGREWADVRYDRLPTVFYSSLTDSLVARDIGARVDMSYGWVRLNLGLFASDQRHGSFYKERHDSKLHTYQRWRLELPYGFTLGTSYRYARTRNDLWAAEVSWSKPDMPTSEFAVEAVRFDRKTQWYFLFSQEMSEYVWAVVRYEDLVSGNRITPGIKVVLDHFDLKVNAVLPGDSAEPNVFLSQLVVRY
ncbi:MAG: hypothetical protein WAP55_00155 [Minisyncoccia bacterium]